MKTKFLIDAKVEAKNIPRLVSLGGYDILTKEAYEKFDGKKKDELYPEVKKLHRDNKKKFNEIKKIYEKIWNKNGEKYLEELEKILEHKFKDDKMGYIVPSLQINIADVIGRKNSFFVAVKKQEVPLDYLLFHEFTHLYYSDYLHKYKLFEAMHSPLMEGIDHLILFKTPIKKLFSKLDYHYIGFVKSNPQFMKELETIWKKRKNFKSFLKEAIKIQRKFKGKIRIC